VGGLALVGVAVSRTQNWHRLHAAVARHHHKETRQRQKFFNFYTKLFRSSCRFSCSCSCSFSRWDILGVGGVALGQVV